MLRTFLVKILIVTALLLLPWCWAIGRLPAFDPARNDWTWYASIHAAVVIAMLVMWEFVVATTGFLVPPPPGGAGSTTVPLADRLQPGSPESQSPEPQRSRFFPRLSFGWNIILPVLLQVLFLLPYIVYLLTSNRPRIWPYLHWFPILAAAVILAYVLRLLLHDRRQRAQLLQLLDRLAAGDRTVQHTDLARFDRLHDARPRRSSASPTSPAATPTGCLS